MSISKLKKTLSKLLRPDSPEFLEELESNIHFLQDPSGDPPNSQRAKQALEFLLEHADEAHPRLVALIKSQQATNPPSIIDALPRFGRVESIPVLEETLTQAKQTLSEVAALALARHPHPDAREALLRGLSSSRMESIRAAADGLMLRGDRSVCEELSRHLDHADSTVRYHVIQAAAHLGCLSLEALTKIGNEDADKDIRGLASSALTKRGE